MEKKVKVSLLVSVLLIAAVLLFGCTQGNSVTTQGVQQNSANQTYSLADVAAHNTPADCWVAIDGNVYNFTPLTSRTTSANSNNFFAQACGTDATSTFQNRAPGTGFQRDANAPRPDFNGTRPDFNGTPRDFNGAPRGTNGFTRTGGRGFSQYLIGMLVQ